MGVHTIIHHSNTPQTHPGCCCTCTPTNPIPRHHQQQKHPTPWWPLSPRAPHLYFPMCPTIRCQAHRPWQYSGGSGGAIYRRARYTNDTQDVSLCGGRVYECDVGCASYQGDYKCIKKHQHTHHGGVWGEGRGGLIVVVGLSVVCVWFVCVFVCVCIHPYACSKYDGH